MAHERNEMYIGNGNQSAPSIRATTSFSHPLEPSNYGGQSSTVEGTSPATAAPPGSVGVVSHDHPVRVQLPSARPHPPVPAISSGVGNPPSYSTGEHREIGGPGASRSRSVVDQEVDSFLLGWQGDLQKPNNNLYPPAFHDIPFGAGNSTMYAKTLQCAYRRQWDQLLLFSSVIFSPEAGEGDIYGPLLHDLLSKGDNSSYDTELIKELCVILHLRWISMVKLKLFGELKNEVNRVHMRVIHHIDGMGGESKSAERRKFPNWAPMGFRLSATSTYYHTDPHVCAEMLHSLVHEVEIDETNIDKDFWMMRGNISLSNVLAAQKKWRLALQSLEKALSLLYGDCFDDLTREGLKIELLSRQGRILLQVGAVDEAQELFHAVESESFGNLSARVDEIGTPLNVTTLLKQVPTRSARTNILLNKGLLFFAREQYSRAAEQFSLAVEEARAVNAERVSILRQGDSESGDGFEIQNQMFFMQQLCMMETSGKVGDCRCLLFYPPEEQCSHLSACLNNLALCALYTCQMRNAVDILEDLIRENPAMHMTEVLTFNLCTLYELGSDNTLSAKKKRTLQLVAGRFGLQDIPVESFRIG